MPMILGHCHLFPAGLPEKRDAFGLPGTAEHLCQFMQACGFTQAQALAPFESPVGSATAKIDGDGLAWLLAQPHVTTAADAPLLPVATINPTAPDALAKLRHACAKGVRMLKFHPLMMGFDALAPACEPFLAAAERARLPITYHTGHSAGWGQTSACVSPAACAALARRHPNLPILMAHCGAFGRPEGFAEAVAACEAHPNLYLEATGVLLSVGEAAWRDAVQRVGPSRLLYGRDYPWTSVQMVRDDVAFLGRIGLDESGRQLALGGNLQRLWQVAQPEAVA